MESSNNNFFKGKFRGVDGVVLISVLLLSAIGILMVFSITGVYRYNNRAADALSYVIRAIFGMAVGIGSMITILFIPYKLLRKELSFLALILSVLLLIWTLIFGQGTDVSAVRRWVRIGPIAFQAVDLIRVGFILSLAWFIQRLIDTKQYFSKKLVGPYLGPLVYVLICSSLVILQPDLGSSLVVLGIGMIMFFSSGIHKKQILFLILIATVFAGIILFFLDRIGLQAYQISRLQVWQDPFNNEYGRQTVMGYISIALGGIFGGGLGTSTQKLGFAIEPHTDLIVTILAEELGLMSVIFIMILYLAIAIKCFLTALKAKDVYSALICIGTGSFFLIQPLINLGGASGIIPLSGVTLPLVSYGMTSMVTTFSMIGIYFNARKHILDDIEREEFESKRSLSNKIIPFRDNKKAQTT